MAAFGGAAAEDDAFEGEVVTFGAAAGKDELVRIAAEEAGEVFAGIFDRFVCGAAEGVAAGRVAVLLREEREHGLLDDGGDRGGGVVVEVKGSHGGKVQGSGRKVEATGQDSGVSLGGRFGMCQGAR